MSVFIILTLSFAGLFWAANHLVTGASGIAFQHRLSPLITGMTIVAIGTSTPEIMVAVTAAFRGQNDIALGNAIGSNIANIGLILGIIILMRPLTIRSSLLQREYPLLFLVMLFTYTLILDGYLGVMDGCLLLFSSILLVGYLIFISQKNPKDAFAKEFKQFLPVTHSLKVSWFNIAIGIIVLPVSAHFLVNSVVTLASWLGLSELVIGLTVVAVGTSLPQVATSLVATLKGLDDIAIGNILGSNMFNLLLVMAFPGIINPGTINHEILWRDIPVMLIVSVALLLIHHHYKKRIARWHGGLLLVIYGCYILSLILNAA